MRVDQLMSDRVVTIVDNASCRDAVGLMARNKIRHLPVTDASGTLCGVVTDRDLRHHLFGPEVLRSIGSVSVDRLLSKVPVRDVMSAPAICIGPDVDLEDAARRMLEGKLGSLPVVDGGRVVGILTETDVLRRIVRADEAGGDVETIVVSYP
jgi:acetoin utilization protein AcuB